MQANFHEFYKHVIVSNLSGLKNERFVYGNDEKAEQFFVQTAVAPRGKLAINSLYDLQMRKFIKEKYGFEINAKILVILKNVREFPPDLK